MAAIVTGPHQDEPTDRICLSLPASAPYARVARLTIASVAARLGFSYDDMEDLRIAVGEVYNVLTGPADSRLTIQCDVDDDGIVIVATREPNLPIPEVSELSRQILAGVTDAVDVDVDEARVAITKRLQV